MSIPSDPRPYYVRVRGRTLGPFDLAQMKFKAKGLQIGVSTPVSRDAIDWRTLADFPEVTASNTAGPPMTVAAVSQAPAPPAVSAGWYYSIDGNAVGPVTLTEIESLIRNGTLESHHHVHQLGSSEWTEISLTPELAGVASSSQRPVAPPVQPDPQSFQPQQPMFPGGNAGGAFCRACGATVHAQTVLCPKCGVPTGIEGTAHSGDRKDKIVAALLAFFLGVLGIHRFYLGDTLLGVLHLLTFGVCGIGAFIDFLVLLLMNQKDFDRKYNRGLR